MNLYEIKILDAQVKTILSLVELKSYFRVSLKLHASEHALILRITTLEKNVGFRILQMVNGKRRPLLTERGKHFISLANLAVQVFQTHQANSKELAASIYELAKS